MASSGLCGLDVMCLVVQVSQDGGSESNRCDFFRESNFPLYPVAHTLDLLIRQGLCSADDKVIRVARDQILDGYLEVLSRIMRKNICRLG